MNRNHDGKILICRPWITTRNGKRIYASQYGKAAFCFWVEQESDKSQKSSD